MICLNCGKTIDDDVQVCPFCGTLTGAGDAAPYQNGTQSAASAELPEADMRESFYEDDPAISASRGASPAPRGGRAGWLAPLLSALSFAVSLICLLTVLSLRGELRAQTQTLSGSIASLGSSVGALDDRLGQLDTTLAGVQSEAYNQYAGQAIVITKDITPLVGPVDAGKFNRMFIVSAQGNLNVNDSFDWQRYNEVTGGWVSIVFTGDATTNEQFGLRLENTVDRQSGTYTSILWANGINAEANGTYRCVITDANGIVKISAEATVTVA